MNDCLDSRIDGHRYFIVVFVISTVILCLMPLGRATILEGEINTIEVSWKIRHWEIKGIDKFISN
jgi:hypothetical protein